MTGFYISAAHKSSGKTTISLGLSAALVEDGFKVQPFKKGPDYIDPIWLEKATGNACYNLDFFTSDQSEIKTCFNEKSVLSDIALVEGNKGLFDGLSLDGSDSNAALASLLQLPVVLVIDTQGMTRGIAPLLVGYQLFDQSMPFAGVILNRTGGERHESKLIAAVEQYTDFKILGAMRRFRKESVIEEHLGLVPANEDTQSAEKIAELAARVRESVDISTLLERCKALSSESIDDLPLKAPASKLSGKLRIGIAQDAAFGFYYADDLETFADQNAELVPINTLSDSQLPEIDGLFIGGGFPERHMQKLAANHSLKESIRQAIENGLPTYAECGGLMYLTRSICWKGEQADMVGVISADTQMQPKPQGRGYTQLAETEHMLWPGTPRQPLINAHEFHYSHLEGLPADSKFAYKVERGVGIQDMHDGLVYKNLVASYTHLRGKEQNPWVQRFVEFVRSRR